MPSFFNPISVLLSLHCKASFEDDVKSKDLTDRVGSLLVYHPACERSCRKQKAQRQSMQKSEKEIIVTCSQKDFSFSGIVLKSFLSFKYVVHVQNSKDSKSAQ